MNLKESFAVLKPEHSVEPIDLSPTIYQLLDERFDNFRGHVLVSLHAFDAPWGSWERHPHGDEIVLLLAGAAEMTLRRDAGDEVVALSEPEDYIVVPRNTWHTASRVRAGTRMLFITPGEGTEHADAP